MSQLSIRPAVRTDVPLILDLIRGLAAYERLAEECVATEALLDASLFGAEPGAEVLLAEVDGATVGFALFFPSYSTFLARRGIWLEDLFVRPAFRGHGIGRALLRRLGEIAVSRGGGRLEWAVLDWNESAIKFYRGLGAVPMNGWTTFRMSGYALERLARGDR
jgi:GNAT superfamily N-acetyltransferase